MADTRLAPPPEQTVVLRQDGRMGLQWMAWLGAVHRRLARERVFTAAIDPPSIAPGGAWWVQITTTGAKPGDAAVAALTVADRDIAVAAQVTAADTVTVWLTNNGAGAVDLGAGTLRVTVTAA